MIVSRHCVHMAAGLALGCLLACSPAGNSSPTDDPERPAAPTSAGEYLYGTIATRFGEPLPNAVVEFGSTRAVTDGYGDYSVVVGDFAQDRVVRISRDGMQSKQVELTLRDDGHAEATTTLLAEGDPGRGRWLQIVSSRSRAIAAQPIRIVSVADDSVLWEGTTDVTGRLWPDPAVFGETHRVEYCDAVGAWHERFELLLVGDMRIPLDPPRTDNVQATVRFVPADDALHGWVLGQDGKAVRSFAAPIGATPEVTGYADDHFVVLSAGTVQTTRLGSWSVSKWDQHRTDAAGRRRPTDGVRYEVHALDARIPVADPATALGLPSHTIGARLPSQPFAWSAETPCRLVAVATDTGQSVRVLGGEEQLLSGTETTVVGTSTLKLTADPGLPDEPLDLHLVRLGSRHRSKSAFDAEAGAHVSRLSTGCHLLWFEADGASGPRTVRYGARFLLVEPGHNVVHLDW